ncbi:MAG: hypothetical protein ACD_3C00233G0001 [uncultured bacterium (gcode 4)]|uniref:Uncharacterized protein n=1 Tax=uncultured bacterium (gcode 4) TaxID=1234023 RepID=K2FW94_9BACT|nr:MAG: hypothetical protein ACD_3C00233G0001 [uncultured bacterium (gcode 4)]
MPEQSQYSKIQQSISYFLIFAILFLNSFQIPMIDKTSAASWVNIELISIIVHEDVYGSISSRIKRYAEDIQTKLNNTKALIYTVPRDITPQKIAALNEKLFYEWDWSGPSRLVWTVLVWDIPLPVIHNQEKTFLSIFPYVDFNEKNFIFDASEWFYSQTEENISDPNPEIWHSIIAPNTQDPETNKIKLIDFFDKDHDYYTKSWVFSKALSDPYVFYYDGKRDEQIVSYSLWKWYQLFLNNIEDIAYFRYTKYLAKDISDAFYASTNKESNDALKDAWAANPDLLQYVNANLGNSWPDLTKTPDVMTKKVIETLTKNFFQIFSDKYIGDILKYVYNTGRYWNTKNTRVDTVISIISKQDNTMKRILKDTNTSLEWFTDNLLKKWLARNIAVPIKIEESKHRRYETGSEGAYSCDWYSKEEYWDFSENNWVWVLENFYYWKIWSSLTRANECSVIKWSQRTADNKSNLVEATRAQITTQAFIQWDIDLLKNSPNVQTCLLGSDYKTMSLWWGYSLLNINSGATASGWQIVLNATDYRSATIPIYNAAWWKEIWYNSSTDVQDSKTDVAWKTIKGTSVNDCLEYNLLYTSPDDLSPWKWRCDSAYAFHQSKYAYDPYSWSKFEDIFKNATPWKVYFSSSDYSYHNRYLFLDWSGVGTNKSYLIWDKEMGCNYNIIHSNYHYKRLLWIVEHKSPNNDEYWSQLKNMSTPSLPVDRNRYVDFTSAKWNQKKFEYPNLFRILIAESRDLNYDFAKKKIKEHLDAKSTELNAIIASENPAWLGWLDKEVYDLLKVNNAQYPSNVDFYNEISKNTVLLDEIVKYVLWLNMNSAELKYKYVFEHYLDIDWNAKSLDAGHKNDYEIAYLGGKWDAENMYVRLNPEKSQDNMTNDKTKNIASNYARFQATLAASKMTNQTRWSQQSSDFKCWPPDGVPIFQWMSAIMCWLNTLVPPIAISASSCTSSTLWIAWTSTSTDFWWDYPAVTNPKYNDDENKNQIPDWAELIKDWKLDLVSDKWMYWYSKTIKIKANLFSSGSELIAVDNYSKVQLDVVKLDIYDNSKKQNVYTKKASDDPIAYKNILTPYISFNPTKVQSKWWVANFAFSSKSRDADVYVRATISTLDKNKKVAVFKQSDDFLVRIRWITLDVSPIVNGSMSSSFEAWSASEIDFKIRTFTKENAPINNQVPIYLNVYNELWANIEKDILIHSSTYKYKSPILTKAWEYRFVFRDKLWIETTQTLNVNPSKIKEIRLTPSSTQFVKWNEADVLVELYDGHGNRARWELYNVTWTISGKWEFSENSKWTLNKWMLEWFANFKVRNTWGKWEMKLKLKVENSSAESEITLEAVEYAKIRVNIENKDKIIVWWDKHKLTLDITDNDNKTLTKFNWVAYFEMPELYGVIQPNFTKIKNGKLTEDVYFVPNFVAGRNLKLNVSVPGIDVTENNTITVLPDKPLYVGLTNSKSKLEAKAWVSSVLKAALYDRYWNLTFNDSAHKVTFEIPAEFKKYTNFAWTAFTENDNLANWVAKTNVYATDLPGSAFITAKVTPWLEGNWYVQTDKSWNKIDIPGMSENIVPFDSYYLFNKSKIDNIDYNSLYTILQWSNYWDITKPWYLWWELLFNKNGRSLGVTAILNNPYIKQTAFGFTPGWKYLASEWASKDQTMSIEADLSSSSNWTSIDLYDSVYKELVAKAWLNLWSDTELVNCTSNADKDISKCQVPQNSSFIVLKWVGDVKIKDAAKKLTLEMNDFSIFSIADDWKITKDPWVKFELDTEADWNLLWVRLTMNGEQIWYLGIKFKTDNISVHDSSLFPGVLNNNKNQIVIEYLSSEYGYDYNYLWTSSHWAKWISFYKIDSTEAEGIDKNLVSSNWKIGLENYSEQAWIWWEWENKMLLEFAGWSSIWESTRFYHTYSMINLWDPVVSLGTKKSDPSDFDKSVWKKILEEKSSKIESYKKMDFNADWSPDIVAFYENWYIELLANYNGNYKNMWNLAYISDAGRARKWVWDFSWDKNKDWNRYDDIAFVDKNGNLGILDNELGKFTRIKPIILDIANGKETALNWAIQQLELFDMDNDGKTDIVTVDDSGELNILYWAWKEVDKHKWKLVFFKKMIDNTLWMTLWTSVTKNWGAIYYDSLAQIKDSWDHAQHLSDSQSLLSDFKSWQWNADNSEVLKTMLDKLVYYQEKYQDTASWSVSQAEKEKAILSAVWTDANGNPNTDVANEIIQAQKSLTVLNWAWMTNIDNINPGLQEKTRTFMRSQFAEANKVWIEKSFSDANWKFLKSNDIINVTLKITNNWSSPIKNVIYYDSNKNFLKHDWESVYTLAIGKNTFTRNLKIKDDGEFDLAFDDFSLNPWETATIIYKLKMPTVSFGKVLVWLLQKNDNYGDIALNPSNQCWANQVIWASIWARSYNKWLQKFEDTTKLPDAIEKNKKDDNNNWIPDYIEEVTKNQKDDPDKAIEYSKEQLELFNKDSNGNWIPDKDEETWWSVFEFDADDWEISVGGLNAANVDAINSWIDNLVNGLGCWFWWGACISMPMNWAPLAPGGSPTLFWMPISTWIWLVWNSTALPLFSFPTSCGPIVIWPPCPAWAWWMFGPPMWGWSSQFRLFITPTITWAVWMAMCLWPNSSAYVKSPWVDPLVPGWQCIVAAAPMAWCSDDGSDWNVSSVGYSTNYGWTSVSSSNSFINANACTKKQEAKETISSTTHDNIIKYMLGDKSVTKDILSDAAVQHWWLSPETGPLIWFWWWWEDSEASLDVNIDWNALMNLDMWNVVKVNFSRVSSFPDYIMDWVTRQLEEIINKLTTLPTLYIILPDFSWFADSGWSNIISNFGKAKDNLSKKETEKNKKAIASSDPASFTNAKDKLKWLTKKIWIQGTSDNMKAAYEVMSNLPLIKMQSEMIDINIPWAWPEDLTKLIEKAKQKHKQYKAEVARAKEDWQEMAWKPWYDKHFKVLLDAENLVQSLEKNVQTLEEYKKFPSKFRKYLTWKENFVTQIMCNLDIINKVTWWWITENWKRFKSWVELIVLLKAILKSYQLIIDVFADFNATCSVCHNERNNLTYWLIKLISALIPKLPIIVFPKWPDIIIDLHNIRAWLSINVPEFRFKVVPIVLPELPDLYLPKVPTVTLSISLPSIPVIPALPELPDLPELPSLPEVKLPDLPPPPKIPNIFWSISAALQLVKLVAKVLCLYRKIGQLLPPEWRAWDAIAWMTERNWVLPMDKLMIDVPQFSIPFVDAIKVTSYVNLEFDVDFIVEMAKSTLEPFNRFANDMSNLWWGIKLPDLDLRPLAPDDINMDINVSGGPQGYNDKTEQKNIAYIATLAWLTIWWIAQIVKWIENWKEELELVEIKEMLREGTSKLATSNDPKEKLIYNTINRAIDFDASENNPFIKNLEDKNNEKYSILKNILKEEIKKNTILSNEFKLIEDWKKSIKDFSPLQKMKNDAIKVSAINAKDNNLMSSLEKNQSRITGSLEKLSSGKWTEAEDIKSSWDEIMSKVKDWLETFKKELKEWIPVEVSTSSVPLSYASAESSSSSKWLDYSYDYKWVYVINSAWKQTRLFDYLDEVDKDSNVIELDYDKDSDQDVVYKMWNSLYLKTNLSKNPASSNHISWVESKKDISDINGFLWIQSKSTDVPLAPNFFQELVASSNNINFNFIPSNKAKDNSFRLEYYDQINRFDVTDNQKQFNKSIYPYSRMNLVDLVTNMRDENILSTKPWLIIKSNFATIDVWVWTAIVKMPDYKVMWAWESIIIQQWKTIYAGESGLTIKYKLDWDDNYKIVSLDRRTNLEFLDKASITVMSGNMILMYSSITEFKWNISELRWFPVQPKMNIEFANNNWYANISYAWWWLLTIDNGSVYEMYWLGEKNDRYSVNLSRENSFYYAKLYEFSKGKKSNITSLSLMAPQFEADQEPPLIWFEDGIKIPVYKKQIKNLKQYIDDVSWISEIYIDFDPTADSSWDGIVDNDKDSLNPNNSYNVHKWNTWFDVEFWAFDKLFKKKILISVKDNNENIATSLIDLEVYSPVPQISDAELGKVTWSIDESISDEPIDIMRYRDWVLEKIRTTSQDKTQDNWNFNISWLASASWAVIKSWDNVIANIDEETWKIDIKDNKYSVSVLGADKDNKTRMQIYSIDKWNIIYEQSFSLPANENIQWVPAFENLNRWIYFKADNPSYSLLKNAIDAPTLPNWAFIKNAETNKAILWIGKDWNIYIMDGSYKLVYSAKWNHILLNIITWDGNQIGSLYFKINSVYIIK